MTAYLELAAIFLTALLGANAFHGMPGHFVTQKSHCIYGERASPRAEKTQLNMVFDFIRKRAQEGVEQVANIAEKAAEGKLADALKETNEYVKERQKQDQENLKKFQDGLRRSRDQLLGNLNILLGNTDDGLEKTLERLEEVLMMADIGIKTTDQVLNTVREASKGQEKADPEVIRSILRGTLIEVLEGPQGAAGRALGSSEGDGPTVIMVIGANGMGKTTTIGKLSARFAQEGNLKVLLGACDTYRAAAVDQLAVWAERAEVDIVKPVNPDDKPHLVVEATVDKGVKEGYDVIILDTSGRLSNNRQLNRQLKKMKDVATQRLGREPHETLLVVDAAVGRNAVDQARTWKEEIGVDGLAVTKLDGTAKGGFAVSITKDLGIPIKLIGVGEKIEDLRDFNPEGFVDALLGVKEEEVEALAARMAMVAAERKELAKKKEEQKAARQKAMVTTSMPPNKPMKKSRRAAKKAAGGKKKR